MEAVTRRMPRSWWPLTDSAAVRPPEYLFTIIPAHEIEHVVDASLTTRTETTTLHIGNDHLFDAGRTSMNGTAASFTRWALPGARYRLGCRCNIDNRQRQS